MIRRWARLEDNCGPETLKHTEHNKRWNPDEKLELISLVLAGNSNQSVALEAGINPGLLYSWVRKYKIFGYNGLVNKPMGRKSSELSMKKQVDNKARPLTESEREELIRLRAEIAYIKAENEVIKKEIALREEKEAARLKAKKQRSSKNSGKKGMN
jgi:transposase-like protein